MGWSGFDAGSLASPYKSEANSFEVWLARVVLYWCGGQTQPDTNTKNSWLKGVAVTFVVKDDDERSLSETSQPSHTLVPLGELS